MAYVVCKLGDECGPMQRMHRLLRPALPLEQQLHARVRHPCCARGGPTGDLRCAPQCTPCEPEGPGDDWQLCLFDKIMAEREANERLKREDPAAYKAKMRAQLPTSKCCLCGEDFRGYLATTPTPCAMRVWRATRERGDCAAAALPQVGAVSLCRSPGDRRVIRGARSNLLGAPARSGHRPAAQGPINRYARLVILWL